MSPSITAADLRALVERHLLDWQRASNVTLAADQFAKLGDVVAAMVTAAYAGTVTR